MKLQHALAILFLALPSLVFSQTNPEEPAQVVVVFLSDPSEFQALEMDGAPFASLALSPDFATVWPVQAGDRKLTVKAAGAADKVVALKPTVGQWNILFLSLKKQGASPAKEISAKLYPVALSKPKMGEKKIYAFVQPGSQPVAGKLMRGEEKFSDVELRPGKLELLGEGNTVFKVGGQVVVSGDPQASGNYVFILIPEADKRFRVVAFSSVLPEAQASDSDS